MLRKTPGFSSFKIGDSQRQKLWEQLHVFDVHIQSIGLIIKWLCSQYHRIFFLRHSLYGLLISIIFVFSFTLTIKFAMEVFLWRSKQKLCYALNFSTLMFPISKTGSLKESKTNFLEEKIKCKASNNTKRKYFDFSCNAFHTTNSRDKQCSRKFCVWSSYVAIIIAP